MCKQQDGLDPIFDTRLYGADHLDKWNFIVWTCVLAGSSCLATVALTVLLR